MIENKMNLTYYIEKKIPTSIYNFQKTITRFDKWLKYRDNKIKN